MRQLRTLIQEEDRRNKDAELQEMLEHCREEPYIMHKKTFLKMKRKLK